MSPPGRSTRRISPRTGPESENQKSPRFEATRSVDSAARGSARGLAATAWIRRLRPVSGNPGKYPQERIREAGKRSDRRPANPHCIARSTTQRASRRTGSRWSNSLSPVSAHSRSAAAGSPRRRVTQDRARAARRRTSVRLDWPSFTGWSAPTMAPPRGECGGGAEPRRDRRWIELVLFRRSRARRRPLGRAARDRESRAPGWRRGVDGARTTRSRPFPDGGGPALPEELQRLRRDRFARGPLPRLRALARYASPWRCLPALRGAAHGDRRGGAADGRRTCPHAVRRVSQSPSPLRPGGRTLELRPTAEAASSIA